MKLEFLGSGGAGTIPKPLCQCRVCVQAREKGVPYSRTGPSLFIHGPDVLFDTPEEIKYQLNRSNIRHINACFYSHWHPDHVLGRRVWEMNLDLYHWPPQSQQSDIYIPQQVALDFRQKLGTWESLKYLEFIQVVQLHELTDGDAVTLNGITIRPFRLAEDYVYAFMVEGEGKRVLIVMDEMAGWIPPAEVQGVDLAVVPMGLAEFDLLTGRRRIPAGHPVLATEATYTQTLEIVRRLKAKQIIMTHIEEISGLSHDDLQGIAQYLQREGLNLTFAYDTMVVEV